MKRKWNDGGFRQKIFEDIFASRSDVSDETIESMASLILDMTKDEYGAGANGYVDSDDAIEVVARAISIFKDAGKVWCVYLLRCADNSLYCGMTSDLAWRLADHSTGRGSKYVRSRLPIELVWSQRKDSKSAALKLEARIKKMKKADKEAMIRTRGSV